MTLPEPGNGGAGRLPGVSLLLAGASIGLMLAPDWATALQWERDASGPFSWLLCHLTHWSWDHLFWDVMVFLGLAWPLERHHRKSLYLCLAFAATAIPLGVLLWAPEIGRYRGLSGLDSGAFGLLSALMIRQAVRKGARLTAVGMGLLVAGFLLKTFYEALSAQTVFVGPVDGMRPVPSAHVIGFLIGGLIGCGSPLAGLPCRIPRERPDLRTEG